MQIEDYWRNTVNEMEQGHASQIADSIMSQNILLSHLLYADDKPSTAWSRFVWRMENRWHRVRDAWLVLTGQAYIDD